MRDPDPEPPAVLPGGGAAAACASSIRQRVAASCCIFCLCSDSGKGGEWDSSSSRVDLIFASLACSSPPFGAPNLNWTILPPRMDMARAAPLLSASGPYSSCMVRSNARAWSARFVAAPQPLGPQYLMDSRDSRAK